MITIYWPWLVILGFIIFLFALITWVWFSLRDDDFRDDRSALWADAWEAGYEAATDEALAILNDFPDENDEGYEFCKGYVKWYENMLALKEGREYDK